MGAAEVEAEDLQVGDHRDAVGPVGEVGSGGAVEVVDGDAEDLSEAEGDDGEVVAAQSQGGGADEDAEDERRGHAGEHGGPEGELDSGEAGELGAGDEGCGVGADAEEGDVSEVEESGEADDDVEAEGDGGDDEDVHAEVGVVFVVLDEGEERGGEEGHGGGESLVPGVEGGEPVGEAGGDECPGAEDDEQEVADERLAGVGVDADAVGEDDQGEGGGCRDDEAFGPGGDPAGRGDGVGLADPGLEGVAGAGQREGAEEGDEGGDDGDVGAGVEVGEASEVDRDGDGGEPGDGEGGGGGEGHGGGGAGRVEPVQAAYVPACEGVQEGEDAGDEGEDLEACGGAVVGEVSGEFGGPGPGHVGAGDGADGAEGDEDAGGGLGQGDDAARGVRRGGRGLRGGCHGAHALSATRSPTRPCGLKSSTRMRRTKAHTEDQPPPPSCCMPGISSM